MKESIIRSLLSIYYMLWHIPPVFTRYYDPTPALANFGHFAIDLGDLLRPLAPVLVLHLEDILEWPVEIVGDVSYLLLQLLEGVAHHPPGWPKSTSNS